MPVLSGANVIQSGFMDASRYILILLITSVYTSLIVGAAEHRHEQAHAHGGVPEYLPEHGHVPLSPPVQTLVHLRDLDDASKRDQFGELAVVQARNHIQ
jgi:hypothetical protein